MPIKPEIRKKYYGRNWRRLSKRLREQRAGNQCELCQRCHLALDREQHKENARATRLDKKDASRPILQME